VAGERDIVPLIKVGDEMEAIRIRDFLAGSGIESQIVSFHDRALDGVSQIWSEGWWGEVRVFEDELERAKQVLADIEAKGEQPEGDQPV
jgi:hypothetical protein